MTTEVLQTRRKAVINAANAFPGGLAPAAEFMGAKDLKSFKNRIYESAGVKRLSDDEICVLETETGTTFFPDYVCGMYGGVFVRTPEAGELDNVDLYHRSLNASSIRGALDQIVSEALADGQIDEGEAKKIRAMHAKYMSASTEAVAAVIELHKARS